MRRSLLALAASSALLLGGCAVAEFQFVSEPEGAVVTGGPAGSAMGTAPFGFTVEKKELDAYMTTPGCYRLPGGYTATWASGAKSSTAAPLDICSPGDNPTFVIRFDRPKDAPGVETDLRAALKNAQLRAEREAMRARMAEMDREMDLFWGFGFWGPGPGYGPPPPHHHHHHHRR